MLYILSMLFVALGVVWLIAPKSHVVFAGVADGELPHGNNLPGRWVGAGRAVDYRGNSIDVRHKFIGVVRGQSMQDWIPDGSRFVADYVDGVHDSALHIGDIVVAKEFDASVGPQKFCYCLRRIKSIKGGKVEYEDSIHGTHAAHDYERVVARVSHVFSRSPTALIASTFG